MNLQSVVDDVKVRVESLTAQGQKVAQISLDTLKQANCIVVDKIQALVKTETTAAKDLFSTARSSFDKAKADGIKAVAAAPISYLPPRDQFITVFNETVTLISDTGDELFKTFKTGFDTIQGELNGKPVAKKAKAAARKTKAAVKKAVKTVEKAAQ